MLSSTIPDLQASFRSPVKDRHYIGNKGYARSPQANNASRNSPRNTPNTQRQRTSQPTPKSSPSIDRFIPMRRGVDKELCHYNLTKELCSAANNTADTSLAQEHFKERLAESIMHDSTSKILRFKGLPPVSANDYKQSMRVLYTQSNSSTAKSAANRFIDPRPHRMLDAPDIMDDYYLNLLDWSDNNVVAVALGQSVYLWGAEHGNVTELFQLEDGAYVSSVSWSKSDPNLLAVGDSTGNVRIWDVSSEMRCIRVLQGHYMRVSALSWNSFLLTSGSRDTNIFNHDVRIRDHCVSQFDGHTREVCGLEWSNTGRLASGGNDNLLNVWDARHDNPIHSFSHHQSAVKAIDWCPWQSNLLASGGGTADQTIRFWNTDTGTCLNTVDTKSQVCTLKWSKTNKELISSHGFSHYQLVVWKYPTMRKITELKCHSARVLYTALSPDGSVICSAAPDQRLCFWKVFDYPSYSSTPKKEKSNRKGLSNLNIR